MRFLLWYNNNQYKGVIMINSVNVPSRYQYLIRTLEPKANNLPLSADDYINIGYMAGRFGLNLCNPNEANPVISTNQGSIVNVNSCTAPLFEYNLSSAGIKFDRLA